MKLVKYLLVLAVALCAITSTSNAQTVAFLGGGSSALFLELGQAAATYEASLGGATCIWTSKSLTSNDIAASDRRTSTATLETGNIWVVWNAGTGTCAAPAGSYNVYSYMSLDSVIGDRCYFEVDSSGTPGCVQVMTPTSTEASTLGNLLCYPSATTCTQFGDTTALPTTISTALNGLHWFVAGTDIRPEDAKFASYRIFQPCGSAIWRQPFDQGLRQTYGLGYGTSTTGVGTTISSFYSTKTFHVLDFNITGTDPINTSATVPTYTVSTVGAQPILVAVAPAGGTGIGAATDINTFTLTLFYQGILGRTTDLFGPTTTAPVITLVREPLSGTYNTFEFSVPNTSQFHGSQDDNNCSSSATVFSNPMNLQSTNGQYLAYRRRVIGTGEMVSTLLGAGTAGENRLGYFFWSAANASGSTATNVKYLTVNGVDPLLNAYSDGVLPGSDTSHPLSNITFKWLNQGDYPVWSALRLVSKSPTPAGVTNLIAAAQTLNSTQNDFIPLSRLTVWHSHYYLPAIGSQVSANGATLSTTGDLCGASGALAEFGGDAGGSNTIKQANAHFCADFGNINGLINKAN